MKSAELTEDTKLMDINSEEGKSSDDICSPPGSHNINSNAEDKHSARRAAVNAKTYLENSGSSETEDEYEFVAAINSKHYLQLMDDKSGEHE